MKITKQRLKEIIKEEIASLSEIGLPTWGDDDDDDTTFSPYDLDAENRAGGKPDDYSEEDVLGVTEPRHEGGTPEDRLIKDLFLRLKTDPAGALGAIYGDEVPEDVAAYVEELRGREMLDNPNMEEGGYAGHTTQSGGKPPKPEAEHSEVSYNPTKETRKTFHKKTRKDARQAIKKGRDRREHP